MSKTIDERVVEMKFDNSKFESNVQTTMSTLDKLKSALKLDGASEGFEKVNAAAGNVKMDGISSACETVQAKFSAMQVIAATALANMANDAVNAGKKIVSALTIDGAKDGFAEYELKMGSVQTIMNGTGESLQTVMDELEELNKYADKTIYSFSDMTSNIGKFTNSGVKLEDAVAAIKGVSNEAAVSGANAQEASRAMYNFAQALSAGYVKLIDWKSIENANMATVEFKNELIKTGLELGTLIEVEGQYQTTTTNAKGDVSDLFDATHAFNEALNCQWMTTDVLTKTLAKYADENTDLGKKAYDAATKVKTFTMMMDTLKEAVGSGWAITWENIIGDFNQATEFFTEATDTLSDVIGKQADSRNKFVKDVFSKKSVGLKEWQEALVGAGKYGEQYKAEVIKVAKSHGIALDEMIEKEGSFEATLKSGWLTNDIFKDVIKDIGQLSSSSDEFRELNKRISDLNNPINKLSQSISDVDGRTSVINTLKNVFEALMKVIVPVKEAFQNVFPPKTADEVRAILASIEEFTKSLILSDDEAKRVKTTFEGFFNVLRKGLNIVQRIAEAFSPLIDIFKILFSNLLEGVEYLGKFFNSMDEGKDSTSLFETILSTIHDVLESFANNLQGYIDKIKESWKSFRDLFSQSFETGALKILADVIKSIKESLSGFTKGIGEGLKSFFESVNSVELNGSGLNKILEIMSSFADGIGKVFAKLGEILSPLSQKLKNFFTEFDFIDGIATSISAGGLAAVVALIGNFIDNILDNIDQIKFLRHPVETICGLVQQLNDLFGSIEEENRVSVVKAFAISVGILAGSIWLIASIDGEAAARSVAIITGLVGGLVYLFIQLKNLSTRSIDNTGGIGKALKNFMNSFTELQKLKSLGLVLIEIAGAVLILATSMKIVSSINSEDLWRSFTVISLLVGELATVLYALSKSESKMTKGASTLIALASSIMILSLSMKILENIDWGDMMKGLLAITALLLELTAASMILSDGGGVKGAGAMIAMASAIMILSLSLKLLEDMEWEDMCKGLITILGLFIELGIGMAMIKEASSGAGSLIVVSAALLILSGALKVIESIKAENVLKVLGVLGGVLLELAIGMAMMASALPGAAALLVVAAAIAVLAPALLALSLVPAKTIYKAIGELAVAMLAFGAIGTILGFVSPLILAFAVALGILSLAIVGIGAGLALAGAGLTALATAFGLISEIGKESAERIVETLKTILNGIITTIPDMVLAVGEGIVKICELISNSGPTIKSALSVIVDVLVDVFTEKLPAITEAFVKFLASLMEQVATYTPQLTDSFFKMISDILSVFAERIPEIIQSGVDIILAFIEGVQSASNQLIDAAMEAIINFINGLADSIDKHTPELIDAVKHLFNSIIDAMLLILTGGNPKLYNKAKEMMDKFKSGVTDKIESIISTVSDLISKILRVFSDKVESFKQAAKDLMSGFINGMNEKVSEAKNAVGGVANTIVTKLRSALDEHSPSKITTEIGEYFTEGLANGIKNATGDAVNSTQSLANSVIKAISGISDMVESDIDASPIIKPVLDLTDIEAGSNKISKMTNDWDNVSVGVTGNLANSNAYAMNNLNASNLAESQNGLDLLRSAINALNNSEPNNTQNNTFNITGDNPKEIANEVSRILQRQVERRGAAWA